MRRCGRVGTPMAGPCGASVTDCSGWPASFSDGGCCSIPTMVRPPLRRLQRSRRLTLSVPQPALQQSAARKCCPGGRERTRRQAPARSVLDDTSTALRSMSEDNARHVECLTAGRKSTLTQKLLGFPAPPAGGMPPAFSLLWFAGILEALSGLLLLSRV